MKLTLAQIGALLGSSQAAMMNTWTGGPTFDITYDSAAENFQFDVTVPAGMWFALGFGEGMMNVDMVSFTGEGAGAVTDLYSTAETIPTTDTTQDFTFTVDSATDPTMYVYSATRPKDTGDSAQDTAFMCNTVKEFYWAGNDASGTMTVMHNKLDEFYFSLDEACAVTLSTTNPSGDDSDSDEDDGAVTIGKAAAVTAAAATAAFFAL
uniref:DOMON domain-containing protein n=1 Tax=Strombidium inclinatum TaxID=197538 RepID=A0A7S3IKH8_9SPIT|mmetsp:Transcript_24521/g.38033  ORF Transcript_24521/g.38033 Transcript_24521/m.38033 type:complete len:208 (+) Transcript_24521:21-644(+)